MRPTNLSLYFDVDNYVLLAFGSTSFETLEVAADQDALLPSERTHDRGYAYSPYFELRDGAPEIYASKRLRSLAPGRWITLDAKKHKASVYLAQRGEASEEDWVLLLRR